MGELGTVCWGLQAVQGASSSAKMYAMERGHDCSGQPYWGAAGRSTGLQVQLQERPECLACPPDRTVIVCS